MSGADDTDPRTLWETLSQTERDAAYDNNRAVADSAALVAERNRLAEAWRSAHAAKLDLAYGDGARNHVDLYPAADQNAPCLVFVHGGYWQRNSREVFAHYAEGARAAGWSVAMPSHTLAPEATLSEIVAEIGDMLDWLAREGPQHGVMGPIVLSGWSAGGHLTAMLLGHSAVKAGLAVSGVYELAPIRDTYLNKALKLSDVEVETLSPLRMAATAKPLAIAYGSQELPVLVHDARALHAMRREAGVPGPLIAAEGANHFTILDGFRTREGALVKAAIAILDEARAHAEAA